MNGIHDMGGMDGFGEVQPQDSEAFHEDWEKQVLAATFLIRTGSPVDESRFIQESIPPADYLSQSYFWRWLHSLETRLLKYGFVTEEELRNPEGRLARVDGFQAVRAEEVETQPGDVITDGVVTDDDIISGDTVEGDDDIPF